MIVLLRILLFVFIIYWIWKRVSKVMIAPENRAESASTKKGYEFKGAKRAPNTVLGVEKGASQDEIKMAYKRCLAQYHPDKVMHLGTDLQSLAKERTEEIIEAYQSLSL